MNKVIIVGGGAAGMLCSIIAARNGCEVFLYEKNEKLEEPKLDLKELFLLAVATSIDALAVGITFAVLQTPIVPAIIIIGLTTFCLSWIGVAIGNRFGTKYEKKAEITGGVVLVLIGLKILLEHLGVINF